MTGRRIAIYGLGRSGVAIAQAALKLGATPTIYDKALPAQMVKQDVLEEARALGIEMHLGWDGRFDPASLDMLVVNPGVDSRSQILQNAKADGIDILSEIEYAYRVLEARGLVAEASDPSEKESSEATPGNVIQREGGGLVPIVAITGTNGKSTTTVMTYLALRACGIDAVLCGNIFGSGLPEMPLTEAAMHATPGQVLVAEISSFQLEWTSHFRPAVAGITNIAPDHLDRYDSFGDYAATKMRIFAAQGVGDYAVVRAFDPHVALFSAGAAAPVVARRHGLKSRANHGLQTRATILTFGAQGDQAQVLEEQIEILDKSIRTEDMQVIGTHNYANTAMAALVSWATLNWLAEHYGPGISSEEAAGKFEDAQMVLYHAIRDFEDKRPSSSKQQTTFDVLPDCILAALKSFKGIEHRMEFLGEKNGVKVINNSMCTNPDAVVKSAQSVKGPNHLIMGGKDKELPFAPVKNYLASGMHKAYLFGEAKEVLNRQLGGGFPTYNTLQDAFQAATDKARPGEVIMLAPGCASTDQFNDFRDRGNVFKKIAKEWLES